MLYEMRNNPNITQKQLSAILGVTRTAVQKHIKYLRDNDYLERVGSNKNGYWLVKD
ncbi:MarR family transcriptional regulator [Peptostreptococcus anaerobius]|nr:MarR family transcriptional regulator [Peptostreptococcus anaerobius]